MGLTLNWTQCAVNGPGQLVTVTLVLKAETRLNTFKDPTMKESSLHLPYFSRTRPTDSKMIDKLKYLPSHSVGPWIEEEQI